MAYVSAPLFKEQLSVVKPDTRHAVVILALREEDNVGSTFLQVVAGYAKDLRRQESRLISKKESQPESCPRGRKAAVCLYDMIL